MKIALIGYGKMGKLLEKVAVERGHEVVSIIDVDNYQDFESNEFRSADVALEFTTPQTAVHNIKKAWEADVKVVCGTTGWVAELPALKTELETNGKSLFWASNFSLGVNLFFEINRHIAKLLNSFPQYDVSITETHHTQKKDAPSGTAITLSDVICEQLNDKKGWTLYPQKEKDKIEITAIREGDVFGIHTAKYESSDDILTFTHQAKGRKGLAIGAVLAAEFLHKKTGYFTMSDLLSF